MSHNLNEAGHDAPFSEISDEESGFACRSGNSKTASEDRFKKNDNLAGGNEEIQRLLDKETASGKHKTQAGLFSRLRRRLGLRSEQSSEARSSSFMKARHIGDGAVGRNGLIFVGKKVTHFYRCIPTPPGCIPTEVMLKFENGNETFKVAVLNRSGLKEEQTVVDRSNHEQDADQHGDRNARKNIQENTLCSAFGKPSVKNGGHRNIAKVLYNNCCQLSLNLNFLSIFKLITHIFFTCFFFFYS